MSNDHPTRETMSLEEATVSNMWEIAAIVECWIGRSRHPRVRGGIFNERNT